MNYDQRKTWNSHVWVELCAKPTNIDYPMQVIITDIQ